MNPPSVGFVPDEPWQPSRDETPRHAPPAEERAQPTLWYDDIDEAALTVMTVMIQGWQTGQPQRMPGPLRYAYAQLIDHCIEKRWMRVVACPPRLPSETPRWAMMMRGQLWEVNLTPAGQREFDVYWSRRRARHEEQGGGVPRG